MQENTSAVLWLYTQDLKSFVSREATAEKGNFATLGESLGVAAHLLNRVEQRKMQDA